MYDTDSSEAIFKSLPPVQWHFAPGVTEGVKTRLLHASGPGTVELIKDNRKRSVYFLPPASAVAPGLYIKHNHGAGPRDRVKRCWRHKGRDEYRTGLQLSKHGIATPVAVAWGEADRSQTFSVTEALPDVMDFFPAWEKVREHQDERAAFLQKLGVFLERLLGCGVYHPDMHAGNIMVRLTFPLDPAFFLLDTHGVKLKKHPLKTHIQQLYGWLSGLEQELTLAEMRHLATPLAALSGVKDTPLELWREILQGAMQAEKRRWPGRRRRYLGKSSICQCQRLESGQWLLAGEFSIETANDILAAHQQAVADRNLLKNDRKRRLSRVLHAGRSYVVKEFLPVAGGRARGKARRTWLNACRLAAMALPVIQVYALYLDRRNHGIVIFHDAGSGNLPGRLGGLPYQRRCQLINATARLVAGLHQRGVDPGDLKASNFVVSDEETAVPVVLSDLDSIKFGHKLSWRQRQHATSQVLESLVPVNSSHLQWRFILHYAQACGMSRRETIRWAEEARGLLLRLPVAR